MMTNTHFLYYPAQFFLEWEIFKRICRENRNTHFIFNKFNFFYNRAVYEIMWKKYCRAGQSTDDNMVHAHCKLDTYGYKLQLRACNIYFFPTATKVARTPLHVTSQLHCLPCCLITPFMFIYIIFYSYITVFITLQLKKLQKSEIIFGLLHYIYNCRF